MEKQQLDQELVKIVSCLKTLSELEAKIYSAQNILGNSAKKRICKYILDRYANFFDWMRE